MPLTKKQFIAGTPEVPRLLQADAYTIGNYLSCRHVNKNKFGVVILQSSLPKGGC